MFGDVIFDAAGKSYTLRMGVGAFRLVEQHFREPVWRLVQRCTGVGPDGEPVRAWGYDELTVLLWAGLHDKYGLTQRACEDIVEILGAPRVLEIVNQSMSDGAPRSVEGANGADRPTDTVTAAPITTPH